MERPEEAVAVLELSGIGNGAIGEGRAGVRQVTELFERALGLERPWRLERTEFDEGARQLDLYVDFERGGIFPCPECGREGCKAYDTTEKSWRHLDFFQHRAFVRARVPRIFEVAKFRGPDHRVVIIQFGEIINRCRTPGVF